MVSIRIIKVFLIIFIITGCSSVKLGENNYRLVGDGYATQESGRTWEETKLLADSRARLNVGIRFSESYTAQKKFADLLGVSIDDQLVMNFASQTQKNLFILERKYKKENGIPIAYSYAVLPFSAPNSLVSSGLSFLFPGLGQKYIGAPSLGYFVLGVIGAGAILYTNYEHDDWQIKYHRESKIEKIEEYYDEMNRWNQYRQYSIGGYAILSLFSAINAYQLAQGNQQALMYVKSGGIRMTSNLDFFPFLSTNGMGFSFHYNL
jgi:hypothetical protein